MSRRFQLSPVWALLLSAAACSATVGGGGGGVYVAKDGSGDGIVITFDTGPKADGLADGDAGSTLPDGTDDDTTPIDDTTLGDDAANPDAPDYGSFFDDDSTSGPDGSTANPLANCSAGSIVCQGTTAQVCDGQGGASNSTVCPSACASGLGCVLCVPGSTTCDATSAKKCSDDGSAWLNGICDAELGLSCDLSIGKCVGPCSTITLERSYIGCEYYPTVTSNSELYNGFDFAVAIASASKDPADVVIYQGANKIASATVPAGGVVAVNLPWVMDLKHDASQVQTKADFDNLLTSALVKNGAYHLKSTRPVTVSQFNPLEFQIPSDGICPDTMGVGQCNSYTNDASMLLPANALGKSYYAVSLASGGFWSPTLKLLSSPGFIAIVATEDNTQVHVDATGKVRGGSGVTAMNAGTGQDFVLNAGDVLQLLSQTPPNPTNTAACATQPNGAKLCPAVAGYDLTGSHITASAPVQVIGGHDCANVPSTVAACDHVEESLFPVTTWGNSVLVAPPQSVSGAATGNGKADVQLIRVISGTAGNQLTFDPAVPTLGTPTLAAGGFIDLPLANQGYHISGTGPILVAQFMASGDKVDPADSGTPQSKGDPSLSLAVPSTQFRKDYVFLVPDSYTYDFVNIIAQTGAALTLDGAPTTAAFTPIGLSGYGVARIKLPGGNHSITGDTPFGVVVYGYAAYTSYMYPGGLNLSVSAAP